jgi:hypothetical protein
MSFEASGGGQALYGRAENRNWKKKKRKPDAQIRRAGAPPSFDHPPLQSRPEWRLLELLRPPSPHVALHTKFLFDSLLPFHKVFVITLGSRNE